MPWQEEWRSQERPEGGQIPDEYSLISDLADNKMVGYFGGVLVVSYIALRTIGTRDTLLAGLPVLMWLMVGIAVLVLIGLYVSVSQERVTEDSSVSQERTEDTSQTDGQPLGSEVEDDD